MGLLNLGIEAARDGDISRDDRIRLTRPDWTGLTRRRPEGEQSQRARQQQRERDAVRKGSAHRTSVSGLTRGMPRDAQDGRG